VAANAGASVRAHSRSPLRLPAPSSPPKPCTVVVSTRHTVMCIALFSLFHATAHSSFVHVHQLCMLHRSASGPHSVCAHGAREWHDGDNVDARCALWLWFVRLCFAHRCEAAATTCLIDTSARPPPRARCSALTCTATNLVSHGSPRVRHLLHRGRWCSATHLYLRQREGSR
jgi:hypothetical protein